ncbi:MAG: serine/threonine protein kinase [Sandaracinus sp.]|nr:serine/threonine protein kinase [Sandaracinus sp.]MCB9635765.1 serine/threonine protein kinase [Sandaracinus sp.]
MAGSDYGSLFDDDGDERTVVDLDLDDQAVVPDYPVLAVFGPFEILGRLARGGMAEVYLAREPQAGGKPRHVVLKRILPEREDDAEFIQMFREEAALARKLYHPNVCHVYETGDLDGRTFMTLEWVYGVSLRTLLRRAARHGGIPVRLACHFVARVAAALDYVHRATGVDGKQLSIVHRDVSPHNVMVGWDGRVKLLDFGIAKTSQAEDKPEGVLKGKHAYLAPEQARGQRVDPRTDIFALGIVFHELLTGRPLYHRDGLLPTLDAILHEPPPSTRAARPEIPPSVDAIVLRALSKEPNARFPTAGHFRSALESVLDELGGAVLPGEVAQFLDGMFGAEDRAPLPEQSAKLTGSFSAASESYSIVSASYGPFGASAPGAEAPAPPAAANEPLTIPIPWLVAGGLGLLVTAALVTWLVAG